MNVIKHTVTVVSAADGTATAYTPMINGRILNVIYTKAGSNNYADTVDFTITSEDTAQNIWVQSNVTTSATVAPRQATHSTAGVAALYAAGGTAVNDYVYLANERVKIVLAQAGNATTGAFTVIVG